MKFPKNRENVFVAVRDLIGPSGTITSTCPVGVFAQLSECEDYCGACEQEAREKGLPAVFRPALTSFYG